MASKSVIKVRIVGDNKDLRGSLDESESMIGPWASRIGKAAAVGLAAAGSLAGVALTNGFFDALDAQSNDALIGARLGLSPDDAAELGDIAASAYRDAWGDSLGDVTNVVTGLESSFDGLGSDDLERLTSQAIAVGDAFEVDTAQGIQTASELVSSGLASSADEAFDLLTRGLQEMPQGIRDELFAASNEYGDFFADLGLTGAEAYGKLTDFAVDGIYGIDKFGDALKELTIRGADMSSASVAAFDAAGLSAETMAEQFLAGGDDARDAIEETAAGLLSIDDPVERANAAIALFGTPLEDLSTSEIPSFLEGLTDMSSGLDGVEGAADDMAAKLSGTTSAKLESFKREALGAIADFAARELLPRFEQVVAWFEVNWPAIQATALAVMAGIRDSWTQFGQPTLTGIVTVAGAIVSWFSANWPTIQATIAAVVAWLSDEAWPIVQQVLGFIRGEFGLLVGWVRENWPQIRETIENVIDAVRVIVETTLEVIRVAWQTWGDTIIAYVQAGWATIKQIIQAALDIVRGIINTVTGLITGDWQQAWDGIKTILSGVWDLIKGIVQGAIDTVKTVLQLGWDTIDGAVTGTWDGIKSFISGTWDAIVGFVSDGIDDIVGFVTDLPGEVAGAVSGGFDAIWEQFRGVINRIIDGWNGLEFSIPKISIPFAPDIPGFTVGTYPKIPRLATGHVATGPMLAVVGEYAGARRDPEIVAPRSTMMQAFRDVLDELDRGEPTVGLQINGDVRLDDVGVDAVARKVNFAMSA